MNIKKYLKTIQMSIWEKTNGGIIYLLPNIFVQLLYLVPLIYLWRIVMTNGVKVDMSMSQMLTYTYLSALLSEMLVIKTPASGWLYEGIIFGLYQRPISIFGHIIAQTIGGWIPMLLAFSLPMIIIAPIFGITLVPTSAWFFVSLLLCISLGFAIEFLFVCLTIKLRGMSWLITVIRMALASIFAGTVIPFKLLPFGLDKILIYQPFAGLGGAPLSIFTGISAPVNVIALQIIWNIILWPLAIIIFRKSQEGMMSYGG